MRESADSTGSRPRGACAGLGTGETNRPDGLVAASRPRCSSPSGGCARRSGSPIYLDTTYTFGRASSDLVARLTPAQRASQLVSSQAPAITTAANPLLTDTFGRADDARRAGERRRHERQGREHGGDAAGAKLVVDRTARPNGDRRVGRDRPVRVPRPDARRRGEPGRDEIKVT